MSPYAYVLWIINLSSYYPFTVEGCGWSLNNYICFAVRCTSWGVSPIIFAPPKCGYELFGTLYSRTSELRTPWEMRCTYVTLKCT